MKTMKHIVTLISAVLFATAVSAGEIGVSGSTSATITTGSSDGNTAGKSDTGRTLAVANDINFDASGSVDELGWTWKWQTQLDAGAIDDTRLEITTSYGTIGLYGTEGGLNFKHGGSQNAIAFGSQIGSAGGIVDPADIGGQYNIQFHSPADLFPYSTSIKLGYGMNGSATSEPGDSPMSTAHQTKGMSAQVSFVPVEGASIGASYYEIDANVSYTGGAAQDNQNAAYYGSYKFANGVGLSLTKAYNVPASASTVATYNLYETDSYSIGYVTGPWSVSAGREESHRNLTTDAAEYDVEIDIFAAAYTIGGATLEAAYKTIENASYVQNADQTELHLGLSLAF
jgi:hypothetical protein